MKSALFVLAACSIGACVDTDLYSSPSLYPASVEAGHSASLPGEEQNIQAGAYLSSLFAQRHHDWRSAKLFIGSLLDTGQTDPTIRKRAMILAMGSGDADTAIRLARDIAGEHGKQDSVRTSEDDTIALIFMIMDAFDRQDYDTASALVKAMPADGMAGFIGPFLTGWSEAAHGRIHIADLKDNAVHLYHAILIADFLKQYDEIEQLLVQAEKVPDIAPGDIERIADIYAHIDKPEKALTLYKEIAKIWPDDPALMEKIALVEEGKSKPLFKKIGSAKEGLAEAFFDISKILFDEYSDESARVFANMALHLNPDLTEARLLLAHITGRHERYDEAVAYYKSIPQDSPEYIESQRKIADIYEQREDYPDALSILRKLAADKGDLESMIKIGDLYRRQENFGPAIEAYNEAAQKLGGTIPEEYWHLYYVRGMAYERAGNWPKAEKDLEAALSYQPEHPYILNYLGYAWADRGINLKESLALIRKAVDLRPSDGYITDSLGWIMYKMGDYKGAVPELEKAVELLPYDPTINDHLGDAYWQVGRKLEARFQWERAKNHSEDDTLTQTIKAKLASGMTPPPSVVGANTRKLNP